ncbi:MAG TPA: ABC transporter substrate-binding protein, partial [Burkholderiaceae bacterium]
MHSPPSQPSRRRVLKTGVALIGASALGAPALLLAQADKIKIGHLTPLTGFLGALGEYAVMGIKMATEEINGAGGVMGRQLDVMSEDSVNPQVASTKAQRMIERDNVAVLMGEINSASALTISQVAARNKKLFMSIGARSDALRGKDCNRYTFHVDIPVTQVCALFGPSAAGGAYIPAFCDIVIMVAGNASMYLGSDRMVEMVT